MFPSFVAPQFFFLMEFFLVGKEQGPYFLYMVTGWHSLALFAYGDWLAHVRHERTSPLAGTINQTFGSNPAS